MKKITLIISTVLITACASTKQFVPTATIDSLSPGYALIHVDRKDEMVGSGRSVEVTEKGSVVGQLSPGKSISWQTAAGPTSINLAHSSLAVQDLTPININTSPGQAYNFLISWSWSANSFVIEEK